LVDLAGLPSPSLCPEVSRDIAVCFEGVSLRTVLEDPTNSSDFKPAAFMQYPSMGHGEEKQNKKTNKKNKKTEKQEIQENQGRGTEERTIQLARKQPAALNVFFFSLSLLSSFLRFASLYARRDAMARCLRQSRWSVSFFLWCLKGDLNPRLLYC
jgi:hypothetical protein